MKYIVIIILLVNQHSIQAYEFVEFEYKFGSKELKSKLRAKVNKLENKSDIYSLVRIGEITKKSSIVFKAIINKSKLYHLENCIDKFNEITNFMASIHEINYARIEINHSDNQPISKSVIEELIFYSEEDCKSLLNYINNVREKEYFWNTIDQFRNEIFIEKNKLYFISMRNQHHAGNTKLKIASLIKE